MQFSKFKVDNKYLQKKIFEPIYYQYTTILAKNTNK